MITELICQNECTKVACWYVWDSAFDITLALCDEHKTELLKRSGKVVGKVGDKRMEQQYKEARQYNEWLANIADRIPGIISWVIDTYPRIFAKELNEILKQVSMESCFKEVVKLLEKGGWTKRICAFEGEYWTRPLNKSAPVVRTKVIIEAAPAQVCEA